VRDITLYQVWSEGISPKSPPQLEETFTRWNVPGTEDGAVQYADRLRDKFREEKANVLVTTKEVQGTIDLKNVVLS
jgi:hypothetical protein